MERAKVMQGYRENGYFVEKKTVPELNGKLGLPASELQKTLEAWESVYGSRRIPNAAAKS
ncbi:MAG: hypothetical protein MR428_04980 [Mesosutterella sp.]|nr:hypothetical protein [Mesosutterella sp.]